VRQAWRRADLSGRDRSLVTISALAAMGEVEQLPFYLRRGAAAGLTQAEVGEAFTHLAFYAGWPRAARALEVSAVTFAKPDLAQAPAAPTGRAGDRPASSNFTGDVWVTSPFRASGGATLGGATVTFAPAARTKWHSHPRGQLLVVMAGQGWTQVEGQPVRGLRAGDVVWTPPGVKHWHGGTRTSGLTHVAVAEERPGSAVAWFGPVSDAEFHGPD
jgi:4-carboxymuconolactone decarboxylase